MGSLMAGWQTKPIDAKEAFKRSTSSVTREEVERFWKAKKELIAKHQGEAQRIANQARPILVPASPGFDSGCESGSSRPGSISESPPFTPGSIYGTPPFTPTSPSTSTAQDASNIMSPGWWQKSYWAFLNEPPVLEDRQSRYMAQYGVAEPLKLDLDAPESSSIHLHHSVSSLT